MSFSQRSAEREYLDENVIQVADLYRNLDELDTINKQLGGYRIVAQNFQLFNRMSSTKTNIQNGSQ